MSMAELELDRYEQPNSWFIYTQCLEGNQRSYFAVFNGPLSFWTREFEKRKTFDSKELAVEEAVNVAKSMPHPDDTVWVAGMCLKHETYFKRRKVE